ncbi:MAG: 1-(5-phosphoribosyl)-5-[(5-phosphoribosylamino)methylideneamino]imidazole-4-carboxamide isomerase [Actinomycetia bacterium]|nr:1-(5-phosphoribosyl)-5-[(5-phosphoribosylamino)methylideneamino]imidazole-4-carboxamide isomerase [Actinomycetes bacterium]
MTGFALFPAIDLRDGRCVRLLQGDYDREVRYDAHPVEVALSFEAAGAPWIHVVDLDAARSGTAANHDVIAAIAGAVSVPVQSGGGVRTVEAANALYGVGVARCVVGTAAVEDPSVVDRLAALGHRVAVGLDVRGDEVAIRGWEQGSGKSIFDLLPRFADVGADAVIVTQIHNDGMGHGPDLDGLSRVLAATDIDVIASGGVGSLEHITALSDVDVAGRTLAGVIVGKAIHDGVISIDDAVAAAVRDGEVV